MEVKKRQPLFWGIILLLIIGLPIFCIAVYYASGYILTRTVGNYYEQHDCQAVVKLENLGKLFPQSIVPFSEPTHKTLAECQVFVSAVELQGQGEWESAYEAYQGFASQYPDTVLTAETQEKSAETLLSWAEELGQAGSYAEAVDKLQIIFEKYGETGSISEAETLLPALYVQWGKQAHDEKAYETAGEKYYLAIEYDHQPQVSTGPAVEAKSHVLVLCKDWGDDLLAQGEFEMAVEKYKMLEAASPPEGKGNAQDMIATAQMAWAQSLAGEDDFTGALDKISEAITTAKTPTLKSKAEKTGSEISIAFSNSGGLQANQLMSSTAGDLCRNGTAAASPLIGSNEDMAGVYDYLPGTPVALPADLKAKTPGSMHYVACIEQEERRIEQCPYRSSAGKIFFVERYIWVWNVKLREVFTGKVVSEKQFLGPKPEACKSSEQFGMGEFIKRYHGNTPVDKLNEWLLDVLK